MIWYYLIKYSLEEFSEENNNWWVIQRSFTQYASALEYKKVLEEKNKSRYRYIVVCSPLGEKNVEKILRHDLKKLNVG